MAWAYSMVIISMESNMNLLYCCEKLKNNLIDHQKVYYIALKLYSIFQILVINKFILSGFQTESVCLYGRHV